ncbi:LysE family translocator [Arhodomonas aquaeolei]|uniref:LysE family translocator n=1 Tax=Arhodomonas aquaeolei TaxID=2369 RepID=UPI002169B68D|nr:LysE family translocator [Arhodomonas aquaeolei]MCS4504125.1 LysE family translocator [Arhodomonas aquaeolei]
MTLAAWLALAGVCVLGAVSPGPSLAVVVRHSVRRSRAHGLAAALAHALGVGVYALLTTLGLAAVVTADPLVYHGLALAGAAYLAWLGIGALRSGGAALEGAAGATAPVGVAGAARDGFLMAFLNPKIAVFFLALFSQFVHADMGVAEVGVFWATATVVDGGWYALVATALTRGRVLAWLRGHALWVDRLTGVVLLVLAAVTLTRVLS